MKKKSVRKQPKKYNITKAYIQYMGMSGRIDRPVLLVNWSAEGIGFGQLAFYDDSGTLCCETECMSKEFIKAVMNKLLENAKYLDV